MRKSKWTDSLQWPAEGEELQDEWFKNEKKKKQKQPNGVDVQKRETDESSVVGTEQRCM